MLDILDYDEIKRELIKKNEGNDITAKFATRTMPAPNFLSYQYFDENALRAS